MSKRQIEDVVDGVLRGDARKNALDFVSFLRAEEIPLAESESYWEVQFRGECVCYLLINGLDESPGPWTIWSDQASGTWSAWPYEEDQGECAAIPVDAHTREIAWAHVNFCGRCGGDCSPGTAKVILGKRFANVCNSAMAFTNPDAEALDCAKEMVAIRKSDILRRKGTNAESWPSCE